MLYYMDKDNELIKSVKEQVPMDRAYKGIIFNTMKEANQWKKFIFKSSLDSLNVKRYSEDVKKYRDLEDERNRVLRRIQKKDNILKKLPEYPNGFFQSEEWRERERINSYYRYYLNLWNILFIGCKEYILNTQTEDLESLNQMHINLCLLEESFTNRLNTKEIQEISKYFKKYSVPIQKNIEKCEEEYQKYRQKTQLKDEEMNDEKEYLLNDYVSYETIEKEIGRKKAAILHQEKSKLIEVKELKDLKYTDILKTQFAYNIYPIKVVVRDTLFVGTINNRNVIVSSNNTFVNDNYRIIIDKTVNGNPLKLPELSFVNPLEKKVYRKNTFRDFYGAEESMLILQGKDLINEYAQKKEKE